MVMLFLFSIASLADYFILSIQSIEFCWQGYDLVFLLELLLNVFYLLYFSLRFLAAPDALRFWLEMNSMVDFFTVPPSLASLFTQRSWLGLRFLRALHLTELPTILQFLNILQTSSSLKLARLVAVFLAYCLTAAGFIHLVSLPVGSRSPPSSIELTVQWASSDPTTDPASSSTPWNSRADASELPASGGHRPALQVSALSSLDTWPVENSGDPWWTVPNSQPLTYFQCVYFLMVTMSTVENSGDPWWTVPNSQPLTYFQCVYFLMVTMSTVGYGDVLVHTVLGRVFIIFIITTGLMQKADACLVLSNKFCKDPHTEDACNIMRYRVYLQNIPSWDWHRGDAVICLAELKLGFMAQGCMVPGLSTLLANLFTMQSPAQTQPGSWRSHYMLGLYNEVYTEELSRDFTGKHFQEVCRLCFVKLRVLLIGIEYRTAKECSSNVQYMSSLDSLETSFSDLHLTQAFASGSVFSVGVLHSLVSATYFNRHAPALIRLQPPCPGVDPHAGDGRGHALRGVSARRGGHAARRPQRRDITAPAPSRQDGPAATEQGTPGKPLSLLLRHIVQVLQSTYTKNNSTPAVTKTSAFLTPTK
ncbi:UNVERIFIED_CONTAM: hypothetical protein FKN15_015104 [Acipenser sinensis]